MMLSLKVAATSGVAALALAVAGCSGGDETQRTTTARRRNARPPRLRSLSLT